MSNFVNFLDIVYPVGSMYFSTSSVSPADTVGGTWEQIENCLLAASGSEYSNVGNFGGSKTITIEQMPSHSHIMSKYSDSQSANEQWEYCFHVLRYGSSDKPESSGRYTHTSPIIGGDISRFVSAKDAETGGGQDYIPYHYSINVYKRTA